MFNFSRVAGAATTANIRSNGGNGGGAGGGAAAGIGGSATTGYTLTGAANVTGNQTADAGNGGASTEDWARDHISQYATTHPWEDFAETFAHYLHITGTLQTAAVIGIRLDSAVSNLRDIDVVPLQSYQDEPVQRSALPGRRRADGPLTRSECA